MIVLRRMVVAAVGAAVALLVGGEPSRVAAAPAELDLGTLDFGVVVPFEPHQRAVQLSRPPGAREVARDTTEISVEPGAGVPAHVALVVTVPAERGDGQLDARVVVVPGEEWRSSSSRDVVVDASWRLRIGHAPSTTVRARVTYRVAVGSEAPEPWWLRGLASGRSEGGHLPGDSGWEDRQLELHLDGAPSRASQFSTFEIAAVLRNASESDVVVERMSTSCGCASPANTDLPRRVPSRSSARIPLIVEVSSRRRDFAIGVSLDFRWEDGRAERRSRTLTVPVQAAVTAVPEDLWLGDIPDRAPRSEQVVMVLVNDPRLRGVVPSIELDSGLQGLVAEAVEGGWRLRFRLAPTLAPGAFDGSTRVRFRAADLAVECGARVRARILGRASLQPVALVFRRGDQTRAEVRVRSEEAVEVDAVVGLPTWLVPGGVGEAGRDRRSFRLEVGDPPLSTRVVELSVVVRFADGATLALPMTVVYDGGG